MNITIFGTGYVGLVTGSCFAEMGNAVVCVDVDADRIQTLRSGQVPIHEPGLEGLVRNNAAAGRIHFTTNAKKGVDHGDILFITVGTPTAEDGRADLRFVLQVAKQIGEYMDAPKIIVGKSTVPVGTADRVRGAIAATLEAKGADLNFDVVSNPEFLKEGTAVNDFMHPDRIIIGTRNANSRAQLEKLYEPFIRNRNKFMPMDERSAELTKYAANAMLAARISLMNELANLADHLGADIEAVRLGIGRDSRIGTHFLYPGTGYGGSCFPKDIRALMHTASQVGAAARILAAVEAVNQRQKTVLVDKMQKHYPDGLGGKRFALWGLAFKPNTDDMREAPSRLVIEALLSAGAQVSAYDPVAALPAERLFGSRIKIHQNRDDTLEDANGLVILTEWNEFRAPDFEQIRNLMQDPVIFDGRNLFDPERLNGLGFSYYAVGRGRHTPRPVEVADGGG